MAAKGDNPGGSPTDPDDINARLAEIHAELSGPARFREPSAAERVSAAGQRSRFGRPAGGRRLSRPERRLAAELRKPVQGANPVRARPSPAPARGRARRPAPPGPVADRGYTAPSRRPSPGLKYLVIAVLVIGAAYGIAVGLHYLHHGAH